MKTIFLRWLRILLVVLKRAKNGSTLGPGLDKVHHYTSQSLLGHTMSPNTQSLMKAEINLDKTLPLGFLSANGTNGY